MLRARQAKRRAEERLRPARQMWMWRAQVSCKGALRLRVANDAEKWWLKTSSRNALYRTQILDILSQGGDSMRVKLDKLKAAARAGTAGADGNCDRSVSDCWYGPQVSTRALPESRQRLQSGDRKKWMNWC